MSYVTAFEVGRLVEPIKAIANAGDVQRDPFLFLPGLRGYFRMAGFTDAFELNNDAFDMLTRLSPEGTPKLLNTVPPSIYFNGGTTAYNSNAPFYILGSNDTRLDSSLWGLTVGVWIWPDQAMSGNNAYAISRWFTTGSYRSYLMQKNASDFWTFNISSTGANSAGAVSGVTAKWFTWQFIVGRFRYGSEISITVNGVKYTTTTTLTQVSQDSTSPFRIGGQNSLHINARMAQAFVCDAWVSDAQIDTLFQQTRKYYGV